MWTPLYLLRPFRAEPVPILLIPGLPPFPAPPLRGLGLHGNPLPESQRQFKVFRSRCKYDKRSCEISIERNITQTRFRLIGSGVASFYGITEFEHIGEPSFLTA